MPNKYNDFYFRRGHYNWMHPDKEQTQVCFRLRDDCPIGTNGHAGFVVNSFDHEESDFDTVYGCAEELKQEVDHYIINTDKEKIAILVEYLWKYLYDDKIAALEVELQQLEGRISSVKKRLESVKWEKTNAE